MHEQRYNAIGGRGVRRRRRVRALMALRLAAVGLTAALALELWAALCWSPRFQVRDVRLVGLRRLEARDIIARANLRPRASLARAPITRIRRQLESLPAVAHAAVYREWPSTLVIVVRERIPAAFVRRGQGIVFIDRDGVAFAGGRGDSAGLPEIRGAALDLGRLGRPQRAAPVRQALAALDAAQETGFQVARVAVGRADLTVQLADGTALHLGRPERLEVKLTKARVALMELQPLHAVEYMDLSCPDAVVWKPRDES